MIKSSFYDKNGNFINKKFLKLLKKSKNKFENKTDSKFKSINLNISIFNSVSKKELYYFMNKLSSFINSGIDIKGALNILIKQIRNPYLKKITTEIKVNMEYGISISDTMKQYPNVFDELTISLISVGEKTGNLGLILSEIEKSMLESIELKSRIKGALLYPVILLGLTITMVTVMMIFVVPTITDSFKETGVDIPKLTQVVINISDFMSKNWILYKSESNVLLSFNIKIYMWQIMIFTLFILFIFYKTISKFYYGKYIIGKITMNIPVFGYIVKQSNIIYFINSFTLLLKSGVLLLESIKISSNVVTNIHYKKEIIRIKNEVENGLTISKSLGLNLEYNHNIYKNKLFPEDFAYIVNVGEETGTLNESIKKLGDNYNVNLKRYIGNLATMLEPFIIIIVGIIVGVIVIAIMLPFFELGKVARNL